MWLLFLTWVAHFLTPWYDLIDTFGAVKVHGFPDRVVELDMADGAPDDSPRVSAGSDTAGAPRHTPLPGGLAAGDGTAHHHVAGLTVVAYDITNVALLLLGHPSARYSRDR